MCDVLRVIYNACGQGALDSVDVALDPSEMEGLDEQALKDKYDDFVKEQRKANSSSLPDDSYEDEKKSKKKKQKVILFCEVTLHVSFVVVMAMTPCSMLLLLMQLAVGQQEGQGLPLLNIPVELPLPLPLPLRKSLFHSRRATTLPPQPTGASQSPAFLAQPAIARRALRTHLRSGKHLEHER